MASVYGWIVTHVWDEGEAKALNPGVVGPRDLSSKKALELRNNAGLFFQMKDGDGLVMYSGRYLGPEGEAMFGPLTDYGTPDGGAVSIWYAPISGEPGDMWEL